MHGARDGQEGREQRSAAAWDAPRLVPLGSVEDADADCAAGSNVGIHCGSGQTAGTDCMSGGTTTADCGVGTLVSSFCTDGGAPGL
jgi:hypothetical protein